MGADEYAGVPLQPLTLLARRSRSDSLPLMSTAVVAERPPTYEEERGKPTPSYNHSIAQMNLGFEFMKTGQFRVVSELSLDLGGRPLTPDLCVYPPDKVDFRRDTIRRTDAPLVTVEIFSPQQGYEEVMEKVTHYLAAGVKSCWVVMLPTRTVTIYTADGAQRTFTEGLAKDPITELQADLSFVFS